MGRTKKIGSAGRYGSRYGRKIRKNVADIEAIQRATHECPSCLKISVRREAFGIWKCNACGEKRAGGAFKPRAHPFKKEIKNEDVVEEILDEEEE